MKPTALTLGSRGVGEGHPCFMLAEVASAHGGSVDVALKMLEAALFDPATRERLDTARKAYLSDLAYGVDGGATRRIVALLRDTAQGLPVVVS